MSLLFFLFINKNKTDSRIPTATIGFIIHIIYYVIIILKFLHQISSQNPPLTPNNCYYLDLMVSTAFLPHICVRI